MVSLPSNEPCESFNYFQVGSKRKRVVDPSDMSKGVARAHKFLKKFADLPLEKMDFQQALQQVKKMKDDLVKDAVDCSWLQQFL